MGERLTSLGQVLVPRPKRTAAITLSERFPSMVGPAIPVHKECRDNSVRPVEPGLAMYIDN